MAAKVVVDTNVGIAANGHANVSPTCELACVELLETVVADGHLVVDAGDRIFDEYRKYLKLRGQPGVGDLFMRWVHDNRCNDAVCTRVVLTTDVTDPHAFAEFPSDAALSTFDPADRKFVAVSAAHPERPPVCAATDRGWLEHEAALACHGITLRWLGP